MPLLDAVKTNGAAARAALAADEVLFALSPAKVGYGVTRGPCGAEPGSDRTHDRVRGSVRRATKAVERAEGNSRPRSVFVRVALAPFAMLGAGPMLDPGNFPASWVGGCTCVGAVGSAARRLREAVEGGRESFAAVTDRRLALLDETTLAGPMEVVWEAPLTLVTGARRRPRLLARARFELGFADGSRIVLSAWPPNIGSSPANRVVRACGSR